MKRSVSDGELYKPKKDEDNQESASIVATVFNFTTVKFDSTELSISSPKSAILYDFEYRTFLVGTNSSNWKIKMVKFNDNVKCFKFVVSNWEELDKDISRCCFDPKLDSMEMDWSCYGKMNPSKDFVHLALKVETCDIHNPNLDGNLRGQILFVIRVTIDVNNYFKLNKMNIM